MNSYNELITLIDAVINRNGVQAITGQVLNGVLKAMVQQLGAGYSLGGVAKPTDDPGTPEAPVCYFASEVGTYTNFGGISIVAGELALLCYDMTDGWFKETMYEGFASVGATIDGNVGTPAVDVTYNNGILSFDFRNMKGNPGQDGQDGAAAGFGTIGATITGGVGTPAVSVQESGPNTAKNLQFNFSNLKGETGVTSVVVSVDNTSGTPQCAVSLAGQVLTLAFTGLKGAQGDTGSSVDYPFTIVNNLTTNDATQALSAAQGVVLEGEISQLEHEVNDLDEQINGATSVIEDYTETTTTSGQSTGFVDVTNLSSFETGKTYKITVEMHESAQIQIQTRNSSNTVIQTIANSVVASNGQTLEYNWTKQASETRLLARRQNGTSFMCKFTISHTIVTEGLEDRVDTIEGQISTINGQIEQVEEDVATLDGVVNGATTEETGSDLFIYQGYIKTDGTEVVNAAWMRSDFIPLESFISCKTWQHPSVTSVAFFSSRDIASFLGYAGGGTYGTEDTFDKVQLTIPDGTNFVIISTENNPGSSRPYTDSSITVTIVTEGLTDRVTKLEQKSTGQKGWAHISFDDVVFCLNDITVNANVYDSIFENEFFAVLKDLHDTYGAKFSLFVFLEDSTTGEYATGWTLAGTTTKFLNEFKANSSWLKFGLHAPNKSTNYSNRSQANTISDYQSFVTSILAITGTVDCIDRLPRLANFAGSLDNVKALRDCDAGIIGALSAYDTRDSYYLTSEESGLAYKNGVLVDATNHLVFFTSLMAMEAANPTSTYATRLVPATMGRFYNMEWMMHEYAIGGQDYGYSNYDFDTMVSRLEQVCEWAKEGGYRWAYPQDAALTAGF